MDDESAPGVRLELCFLAGEAHTIHVLTHDFVVEITGVQHEHGFGLDQVRVGRWFLGSIMMVAILPQMVR